LSAERIKDELQKFLLCPNTYMITCVFESGLMSSFGIGSQCPDLEEIGELPVEGHSRLCAMCYALEKENVIRSARSFLEDLHFDRHSIKMAETVCNVLRNGLPAEMKAWKHLLASHGQDVCVNATLVAKALDNYDFGPILREIIESGECWSTKSLAINGNDLKELGWSGKALGQELEALLMYVIEYPNENTRERLMELAAKHLDT